MNRLIVNFTPYHFFSKYNKSISKKGKEFKINKNQHAKIIKLAHILIAKGMIEDKFIFRPPYLPCKFRVKKYKQVLKFDANGKIVKSNLPVNWKATKDYWNKNPIGKEKKLLIYYLNDHSDGFRYKFMKGRKIGENKNLSYYSFLATRENNRNLAAYILNPYNNIEFYE